MNPFQDTYERRLRDWHNLRSITSTLSTSEACVKIDHWWQQAPTIKQHLHWADQENWTDPWTLLSENTYCPLTRAIGMLYSLILCGINDVELVIAADSTCEEHYLVLVDSAKYTLNWWPDSVLNTSLDQFTILRSIPIVSIQNKIK